MTYVMVMKPTHMAKQCYAWNVLAFCFKKLNIEYEDNVKNHFQTLIPSLWLLI